MQTEFRREIELELSYLTRTVNDAEELLRLVRDREKTIYDNSAGGLFLAQYYNGIENILKRICKSLKVRLPHGEQSHIELFTFFCSPPSDSLPLLFPDEVIHGHIVLRRFRHFVHHGYAFQLDWERLSKGLSTLRFLFEGFKERVLKYLDEELL